MEENTIEEKKESKEAIKDMVSLYFIVREKINDVTESYKNYELLIESISIGMSLISDKELKLKIEDFLKDSRNYPKITDMQFQTSSRTYSIGTGQSGIISVRPEDLEVGKKHLVDQQCNSIIPRLRVLDNKVMSKLIEEKIIPSKKETMGDMFIKRFGDMINDIQN